MKQADILPKKYWEENYKWRIASSGECMVPIDSVNKW